MAGHSGSVTQATVLSDHSPFIHPSLENGQAPDQTLYELCVARHLP